MAKMCEIYEDKICNNCKECMMCELDTEKECDNCGKCLEEDKAFRSIKISEFFKKPKHNK